MGKQNILSAWWLVTGTCSIVVPVQKQPFDYLTEQCWWPAEKLQFRTWFSKWKHNSLFIIGHKNSPHPTLQQIPLSENLTTNLGRYSLEKKNTWS